MSGMYAEYSTTRAATTASAPAAVASRPRVVEAVALMVVVTGC